MVRPFSPRHMAEVCSILMPAQHLIRMLELRRDHRAAEHEIGRRIRRRGPRGGRTRPDSAAAATRGGRAPGDVHVFGVSLLWRLKRTSKSATQVALEWASTSAEQWSVPPAAPAQALLGWLLWHLWRAGGSEATPNPRRGRRQRRRRSRQLERRRRTIASAEQTSARRTGAATRLRRCSARLPNDIAARRLHEDRAGERQLSGARNGGQWMSVPCAFGECMSRASTIPICRLCLAFSSGARRACGTCATPGASSRCAASGSEWQTRRRRFRRTAARVAPRRAPAARRAKRQARCRAAGCRPHST